MKELSNINQKRKSKTFRNMLLVIGLIVFTLLLNACNEVQSFLDAILPDSYETILSLRNENDKLNDEIQNYYELINEISTEHIKANVLVISNQRYFDETKKNYTKFGSYQGSGVIFDEDEENYYILTNFHVTQQHKEFNDINYNISDYQGNSYGAALIYTNNEYDLSILKIKKQTDKELLVLEFEEKNPNPKETVIAIGHPNGQANAITIGVVTNYQPILVGRKDNVKVRFKVIKHTAPINSGSSGGVLMNTNLKIVGINFAKNGFADDESYSIPVEKVKEFLSLFNYKK